MASPSELAAEPAASPLELQLRADLRKLSPKLREVAQYCLAHARHLHLCRIQSVAEQCQTQPVSVVRLAKRYGYRGFMDFKMAFLLRDSGTAMPDASGTVIDQCRRALSQRDAAWEEGAMPAAAALLQQADTVWMLCTREALPIAQCYAELLRLAGLTVRWLSPPTHSLAWEWQMAQTDAVLCVSLGTPDNALDAAVAQAERQGIAVLAITDNPRCSTRTTVLHLHVANLGKGMQGLSAAIVLAQAVHSAHAPVPQAALPNGTCMPLFTQPSATEVRKRRTFSSPRSSRSISTS